jgi:SAM-dependent methyltransferase
MLDVAAVSPGTRLLDAGCGAGGASVLAAARGAQVNGCDVAEGLLTIARQRVPDSDFRVAGLEQLPYADAAFDAIIVPTTLAATADPLAALHELRRVCTADGRVVVAIWCGPEAGAQHAVCSAMHALLAAPARAMPPCGLAVPGRLDGLLVQAGLRVLGSAVVVCPSAYPDGETAWLALASSSRMQATLRAVGTERLKDAVLRAIAPYRTATGSLQWETSFRYVLAAPVDDGL